MKSNVLNFLKTDWLNTVTMSYQTEILENGSVWFRWLCVKSNVYTDWVELKYD